MPAMDVRPVIRQAGGLHTIGDLGARWGVSKQRAAVIVRLPGFPAPITTGSGVELWPGSEADRFRRARLARRR